MVIIGLKHMQIAMLGITFGNIIRVSFGIIIIVRSSTDKLIDYSNEKKYFDFLQFSCFYRLW